MPSKERDISVLDEDGDKRIKGSPKQVKSNQQ
jgi:hypothetical protein